MVCSRSLRAERSALGTEPGWCRAGRPRPEDPHQPFVNCLVAPRILFWSLELLGSYEHWMLINGRLAHLTKLFGSHHVQDVEIDPQGNWKLGGMKHLPSSCSQFDMGSIRLYLCTQPLSDTQSDFIVMVLFLVINNSASGDSNLPGSGDEWKTISNPKHQVHKPNALVPALSFFSSVTAQEAVLQGSRVLPFSVHPAVSVNWHSPWSHFLYIFSFSLSRGFSH